MKQIKLALDVYDRRIHAGAKRYFNTIGMDYHVLQSFALPWLPEFDPDDGFIVFARLHEHSTLQHTALKKLKGPFVSLGQTGNVACPQVLEDNYEAGQLAAEYFLKRMFRHFLIIGQNVDNGYQDRILGFEDTLARHGMQVKRRLYEEAHMSPTPLPKMGWNDYIVKYIRNMDKPLAVFALDDHIGSSVLRHCAEAGFATPEDVAVLGVGNDHLICDYGSPLSSIDMDYEQIGWKAAELLYGLMNGQKAPKKPILIPPRGIVERRSTEILSAEDPRAVKALRYLMDNLHKSLKARDVARAVGLSPIQLNRIFINAFGRTIAKELLRLRNHRIQELLATTAIPAKEIASKTGFRSLSHMTQIFVRENKVTPKRFRDNLEDSVSQPWDSSLTPSRLIPHKVAPRK